MALRILKSNLTSKFSFPGQRVKVVLNSVLETSLPMQKNHDTLVSDIST